MDLVTHGCQPGGMDPFGTTHVQHLGRRGWQIALQEHLCPHQLQGRLVSQAAPLLAPVVVSENFWIQFHAGDATSA